MFNNFDTFRKHVYDLHGEDPAITNQPLQRATELPSEPGAPSLTASKGIDDDAAPGSSLYEMDSADCDHSSM